MPIENNEGDFVYSTDNEYYIHSELNDALDSIHRETHKVGDYVSVWRGIITQPSASFYAQRITADMMGVEAYDLCGDYAEEWPALTLSLENKLNTLVNETIDKFFTEHKLQPTFGAVTSIVKLTYIITDLEDVSEWALISEVGA